MATVKQVQVTFDCADPRAVAEFWKAALGYVDPPAPLGFDSWDAFDRLHLDVRVGTGLTGEERVTALEAEAARLEAHGARRLQLLPADEENEACLVMQDVEGNEFCLDQRPCSLSAGTSAPRHTR